MTEDEADEKVATLFDEITKVEIGNGRPRVSEMETVAQMDAKDMEDAVADLVRSFKDFSVIMERGVNPTDPLRSLGWWRALEFLALVESSLKECFCRSKRAVKLYHEYRLALVAGKKLRADA